MKKSEAGQSLIEVMAAILVIVLVVLALVSITTVAMRNASFSRNQTLATKYAQEAIERIRAYRDEVDWVDFDETACEEPDGLDDVDLSDNTTFTRTISCTLDAVDGDLMDVAVTVSWQSAKKTHQSQLSTKLTQWQ